VKPANKCVGVADYLSAKLKNLVSYHAVGKGGSCIFFYVVQCSKVVLFWCKSGFSS